jgi:predicted dehydrogenase
MKQNNIGIAVVGAGRIGTLRARLAAKHPSVRFLAISDHDPAPARVGRTSRRQSPHCMYPGSESASAIWLLSRVN